MAKRVDALGIRRRLGRTTWGAPVEFGVDGWRFDAQSAPGTIIVTCSPVPGGGGDLTEWLHASISRPQMPTYEDLAMLHAAVWPTGYAYQVFAPPQDHVNIHPRALHLWGRLDGGRELPHFGVLGVI